jgi:hypothetical protein
MVSKKNQNGTNLVSKEKVWIRISDNRPFILFPRYPLEEKN